MTYQNLIVETRHKVGIIRLNRPHALNALNAALITELSGAIDGFETDPLVACIIITGSDKAFAAGADIKEMAGKSYMDAFFGDFAGEWDHAARARKPIIAAVAGFALGGGCELAMQCDFIIAADNAKFGQPEIKLGVIPGIGGTQRLTRAIGKAKAMDLILTGRMMDAAEAERAGLVARVVPLAEPDGRGDQGGRDHRGDVAALADDRQGGGQPRVRDEPRRGDPVRAAGVPLAVRHRGPEGGHGRLRREACPRFQEPVRRHRFRSHRL